MHTRRWDIGVYHCGDHYAVRILKQLHRIRNILYLVLFVSNETYEALSLLLLGGNFLIALLAYIDGTNSLLLQKLTAYELRGSKSGKEIYYKKIVYLKKNT